MLVMRVAEILQITVIAVLLVRAQGEKLQLSLRPINTYSKCGTEMLYFDLLSFQESRNQLVPVL